MGLLARIARVKARKTEFHGRGCLYCGSVHGPLFSDKHVWSTK